jgi:predicted enzyme related to lactoylglutathione lyase
MAIKKIELGWVTTGNIEVSKEFFTKKLGLTVNVNDEQHGWMEFAAKDGGAIVGVCMPMGQEKPGQNAIMVFTVDDIVATKKELEARGVTFVGDIMDLPQVKLATFIDPDGNKFQLAQNK